MMELLSKLIEQALLALFECGQVDWTPDDGAPETFLAECEIEGGPVGDYYITLGGVFCIVGGRNMEMWHYSRIATTPELQAGVVVKARMAGEVWTVRFLSSPDQHEVHIDYWQETGPMHTSYVKRERLEVISA